MKNSAKNKSNKNKESKSSINSSNQLILKIPSDSFYGTGKRKNAISRVWIFKGKGDVSINDSNAEYYLKRKVLLDVIHKPLQKLGVEGKYSIVIHTKGGGLTGQAYASQLGISRALVCANDESKSSLKEEKLLTRDSRIKERKKYGRKKARKGYQFRKR